MEVNTASVADLDATIGIGPALSRRIIEARAEGEFKDWPDLIARVKGLGARNAARLGHAGLVVNGQPYGRDTPAPEAAEAPAADSAAPASQRIAPPAARP